MRSRRTFSGTIARAALVAAVGAALGAGQAPTTGTPLPTPDFHHLHLNSANPDAAVTFYQQQFPTTSMAVLAGLPALRAGRVHLVFSKVERTDQPAAQSAYWHFGWHVPNTRDYWLRYQETGAPLMPLYTADGGSVTFSSEWWPGTLTRAEVEAARARGVRPQGGGYGYLRGPDGVMIEFQGDLPVERFNHVHLYQEDVYCAELWYGTHLHAPISGRARRSPGRPQSGIDCRVPLGEPTWLSLEPRGTTRTPAGGVVFGDVEMNWYQRQGAQPLVASRGQVMDHVGLAVADLDRWLSKLRREGVTIVSEPRPFGGTRSFFIEGPSRELVELVEVSP